uniref:NADH dehydrogenase subunit 4 n=1 Tax=Malassezia vespertilionis TaxID=2020962 RepID=UPI0030035B62|nr:NADH dehydrogenase subunit 4 [Malassezia vespertilionis]
MFYLIYFIFMIILILLFIPIIGIILISTSFRSHDFVLTLNSNNDQNTNINTNTNFGFNNEDPDTKLKVIALITSIIAFLWSLSFLLLFDPTTAEYQFTYSFANKDSSVFASDFQLGIDGISIYFVVLTTFLFPISFLASWKVTSATSLGGNKYNVKFYLCTLLTLEILLILVFVVTDIILFYIFFESVLIPLFLIVGIWGGSPNRVRAAFLLFLFTLIGSLFMLLSILALSYNIGSTDFTVISQYTPNVNIQKLLWLGIFISMAVKFPLWPFYSWLYRAHAEAPIAGSILLAGIVLKMATYGSLRLLLQFLPDASCYYSPLVQTLAVISVIYASLATLRQTDFKALVAYSSVGHMGIVALGLFSNNIQGVEGSIVLSVAHGFVSPALFMLVGAVLYDRFHTRTIRYYRGVVTYMPVFTVFFFLFTIFNAGIPLSANWIGEALCLMGSYQMNPIVSILGSTGIVLSAAYSIWLYNRVSYGNYSNYLNYTTDINRREFNIILPLFLLTVLFGVMPNLIIDNIDVSVTTLLYKVN